jgi:hypothetical protein
VARWLAVLPAAFLGAFLGWSLTWVLYLFPHRYDATEGAPPSSIFAATFTAMFFVAAGAEVAPVGRRGKVAVVVALAVLEVAAFVLISLHFGFVLRWPNVIANAVGLIAAVAFTIRHEAFES